MSITLYVDRMVGGSINVMNGDYRDPALTRLWWTTPRSGNMQSRDAAYSDVAITGVLTQSKIDNIDGHSRTSVVAVEIGNTVTSIGTDAFSGCSDLTSVTIPDGVTNIGNYAFYLCSSLVSVTIPNSVTSIGNYAISLCQNLTSLTINGIPSIGLGAFSDNQNLQEVLMESFQCDYVSIHGVEDWGLGLELAGYTTWPVIVHCQDGIVALNGGEGSSSGGGSDSRMTWVQAGNGYIYEALIEGEFNNTMWYSKFGLYEQEVAHMRLGTSVTTIREWAFQEANNLYTLVIPSSISMPGSIGEGAFYYCDNLTEVWFDGITRADVAQNAPIWHLGVSSSGNTFTVICHCIDGILVLHGDAGSSSDGGGEDEREHPYTRVIYQNGAATEKFNFIGILDSYSLNSGAMGYYKEDITDIEVGTDISVLDSGALSWFSSLQRVYIPSNIVDPTQIQSGAFDGSGNLEEVWFMGLTRYDVSRYALAWGLGENSMTYQTHPVICHCLDGLLVLHGDSGSSGSGSGSN